MITSVTADFDVQIEECGEAGAKLISLSECKEQIGRSQYLDIVKDLASIGYVDGIDNAYVTAAKIDQDIVVFPGPGGALEKVVRSSFDLNEAGRLIIDKSHKTAIVLANDSTPYLAVKVKKTGSVSAFFQELFKIDEIWVVTRQL